MPELDASFIRNERLFLERGRRFVHKVIVAQKRVTSKRRYPNVLGWLIEIPSPRASGSWEISCVSSASAAV